MAVARKSGNNPANPNVVKSGLLARKPVRRRAPLRVNNVSMNSQINQTAVSKEAMQSREIGQNAIAVTNSSTKPGSQYTQSSVNSALPAKPQRSQVTTRTKSRPSKQLQVKNQGNLHPKSNPIPVMPGAEAVPFWLKKIQQVQRYTSILTFALVSATLAVYALNVYSQQSWGMAYKELQRLQKNEQQLTTKNEVLKNKMAGEAEKPSTGLMSPSPAEAIFISPPTSVPAQVGTLNSQQPNPQPTNPSTNTNPVMGY